MNWDMNSMGIPSSYIHPKAHLIDVGFGHYSFEHRGLRTITQNGGWMTSVVTMVPAADIGVGIFSNSWFDEPSNWASLAFFNALALDILDHYLDYKFEDWVGQMKFIVESNIGDPSSQTGSPSHHQHQ